MDDARSDDATSDKSVVKGYDFILNVCGFISINFYFKVRRASVLDPV